MKIIVGDRGSGKTTRLLQSMRDFPGSVLVAPTQKQAETAFKTAEGLGYGIERSRFLRVGAPVPSGVAVFIDEIDGVIGNLFGGAIQVFATTSSNIETLKPNKKEEK